MRVTRWEDQEKITKKIAEGPGAAVAASGKKGKKGGKGAAGQVVDGTLLGDFRTEYAKSGAAKCRKCGEKIAKVRSLCLGCYMSWNIYRARLEYVRRIMMMKEQNSMDLLTDGGRKPNIITKGPHVSTCRYHVSCFAEARDEMVFFCSADKLAGYNTLSKDDQV